MDRLILHRLWIAVGAIACTMLSLQAQNISSAQETALRFLQSNPTQFNLSAEDVADVRVTDAYPSKHNGVTHIWVQQQYAGIPVYNALFGLHVKPDGSVFHLGHRFEPGLAKRVNTTLPSLSAAKALELAMQTLGFTGFPAPAVRRKINDRNWVFESGAVSRQEIPVQICYDLNNKNQPRLAWKIGIDQANTPDVWTLLIDAQSGQVLHQINHTVYCKAGHPHPIGEDCPDETAPKKTSPKSRDRSNLELHPEASGSNLELQTSNFLGSADESYRIFPLPVESPAHGARQLVLNPADPAASPFGWLDTDGAPGPEYTYTRGNNVWAFEDSGADNIPSPDESANGGPTLNFDFPFDANAEPESNLSAAITNLFYMNNKMHDISYRFSFDEPAGNFQTNNYGKGGAGSDAVLAQAIDGADTDNANFSTPSDGGPGRMQMYKWSRQGDKIVKVNAPGVIAGGYPANHPADWSGAITTTPITGEAVFTNDGSGTDEATQNCFPPVNDLQGKIALIDRGTCEFGRKALTAEQAGAKACIICGFNDDGVIMGPGTVGGQVTIPTVYMTKTACDVFRQYAGNGLNISLVLPSSAGPEFIDGDVDNGIIAHEYGHGISNRLTGGPSQSGCLANAEQMGEGWSDFFALATTVKPGDVAQKKRGIATYVLRQPNDGIGLRRYPYSTDMSINPITFGTVAENTEIHALGEIWAQVTWDLYWALVEKYGYDADLSNTNSGNFRAVQLVTDGLKIQPCSPGFIDGRDAIMGADLLNYNGVDSCLISAVFARRGLGYFASQGLSTDAADGIENFDPIPLCVKELKIQKETSTPFIAAGEDATFTLTVTNHKDDAVTNVVVTDPLPAGLSLGSASNGGFDNNGVVTWNLGTLASRQEVKLTYTAKSDAGSKSILYFRDDMEAEGDSWASLIVNDEGNISFLLQSDSVKVGNLAWRANAPELVETDQSLVYYDPPIKIYGNQPVMRFWHNYKTEKGADGGFLEIQLAGEAQWRRLAPEKVFRDGYPSAIQYNTFATPNVSGFSGNSNGWVRSYFDLSDYKGKEILFRFRFGTDDNITVANGGWIVDQVDILDMLNYDSEACVSSAQGDQACDQAPARGVIVDADATVGAPDPVNDALGLQVQPNPASDLITLRFGEATQGAVEVLLFSADGRVALRKHLDNVYTGQLLTLDIQQLPAGLYVLRAEGESGSSVVKVTKN